MAASSPSSSNKAQALPASKNKSPGLSKQVEKKSQRFVDDEDEDETPGYRLPINLVPREHEGLEVSSVRLVEEGMKGTCLLVTINDQSLKGKSIAEIHKLCMGAEGAESKVGVIDSLGTFKTFTFKYELLSKEPKHKLTMNSLLMLLHRFDGANGPDWDTSRLSDWQYYDSQNLDLFTTASAKDKLTQATDNPLTSMALINSVLIESVANLFAAGNRLEAQRGLALLKTMPLVDSNGPRVLDKQYGRLLMMLDLFGQQTEAIKIGREVIATEQSDKFFGDKNQQNFNYEERLGIYKAYLDNFAKIESSNVDPSIIRWSKNEKELKINFNNMDLWCGDFFEKQKRYDKAITYYENALSARQSVMQAQHLNSDLPDKTIAEARDVSYLLFRIAQLYTKQDSTQKAIEYLLRARNTYASFLTEEQLAKVESVPFFSPTPGAIDMALAEGYLQEGHDTDAALHYAKLALQKLSLSQEYAVDLADDKMIMEGIKTGRWNALITKVSAMPGIGGPGDAERTFANVFLQADAAITSDDKAAAQKHIAALLGYYQGRQQLREFPRPPINMYCCLLHLARSFADRGDYDNANRLLSKLQNTGSELEHTLVTALFIDIEKALNAEKSGHPEPKLWQHILDVCKSNSPTNDQTLRSIACLYLEAGKFNSAQTLINKAFKLIQGDPHSDSNAAFSTALLYLDKAHLEGNRSNFVESQRFFAKAITIVDALPVARPSRELDDFNRAFMCRAVDIARLERLNRKPELAKRTLKEVILRVQSKNNWLAVFTPSERPTVAPSQLFLYGYYARLLCEEKKFDQARTYLDEAIKASANSSDFLHALRADCAAHQGDYATAALDLYALVAQGTNFDNTIFAVQPKLKETYSRMALNYGLKAKHINSVELSKLYMQMSQVIQGEKSNPEKLMLSKKAYELVKKDSPEQEQLMQQIINLSLSISGSDQAALLEMQKSQAILAEQSKRPNARQMWVSVAAAEIQAKQFAQGIRDINRALDLEPTARIDGASVSTGYGWLLNSLADSQHKDEAESLLKKALNKNRTLYGATSTEYSETLQWLAIFYAKQKNANQAFDYLNQFLAIDPRRQELGKSSYPQPNSLLISICGWISKTSDNSLALKMLQKILESRTALYGSDDEHIAEILEAYGKAESTTGDYEQAEKHFRLAILIDDLYRADNLFGWAQPRNTLRDLLIKEKRNDEAKRLQAMWKSDQNEIKEHWALAENASEEKTKEFYDWWHVKAPYNFRCINGGIKLLEYAVNEKDWERVRELAPECIRILSHQSLYAVGGCTPSPQPAQRKFYCFKVMVEACVKSNHTNEAIKWAEKAVAEESYDPTAEELVFLSEIELACGNREASLMYCKKADETISKTEYWTYWRESVEQIYKKLDAKEELKRHAKEADARALKVGQEKLQKFEERRKSEREKSALLKQPPTVSSTVTKKDTNTSKQDSIEPSESLVFPPVEAIHNEYVFNYAVYAVKDLFCNNHAQIVHFPGRREVSTYSFGGSYTGMATCQPLHQAGVFNIMYDGPPGSLITKSDLEASPVQKRNNAVRIFTSPPPVMSLPLKPGMRPPPDSTQISTGWSTFKAGNYITANFSIKAINMPAAGKVRIFVQDLSVKNTPTYTEHSQPFFWLQAPPDKSTRPVFEVQKGSHINWQSELISSAPKSTLEMWYDGTGEIWLDDDSYFAGIIYAPNATIRLFKRVNFLGAMVASEVIAGDDSRVMYEPSLQNWKP